MRRLLAVPDLLAVAQRRLLANAYLLHVTHLTTGMRLGAAAAEKLNLFRVRGGVVASQAG